MKMREASEQKTMEFALWKRSANTGDTRISFRKGRKTA